MFCGWEDGRERHQHAVPIVMICEYKGRMTAHCTPKEVALSLPSVDISDAHLEFKETEKSLNSSILKEAHLYIEIVAMS